MVTSRRRWRTHVSWLVLAAIVAACGGQPQASPGQSAVGATPAQSAGPIAGPARTGRLDAAQAAQAIGTVPTSADAFAAPGQALGQSVRDEVNAARVYGPVASDLQSLMDQAEATAFQRLTDKVKAAYGGATGVTGTIELAGFRPPAPPPSVHSNMALLSVAIVFVAIAGGIGVSSFDPRAGGIPPISQTDEETVTKGSSTLNLRATFAGTSAGGVVTFSIILHGDGSGTDAGGKATSMNGDANITFSINPCPDPAGHVSGTIALADDETFSSEGAPTIGYKINGTSDYVTTVDDNAELASTQVKSQMDRAVTTAAGTNASPSTIDVGVTADSTFGPAGGTVAGATDAFTVDNVEGPAQASDVVQTGGIVGTFGFGPAITLSGFAHEVWRSGRCFEVRPQPNGGDVAAGGKTTVQVTVYHWVDKADIEVPVKATLAGTASVDPNNSPVTSPATFTYTAGAPGSSGDVTYKVTSRRGIGDKTSHFKVQSGLFVDVSGTLDESAGPAVYHLAIRADKLYVTAKDDGSLTVSGQATVKGSLTAYVCKGTINEKIDVTIRGQLTGPSDAPVFHLQFGPGSLTNLGGSFSCPGISVTGNQGDFFGQWSTTLGYVDIPAAGGTVPKRGTSGSYPLSRNASGTFVATPAS